MQVDRSVSISVSCWYRLVAPENVPLRVSLSETAPGVVSGVSLVDVFRFDAPWLHLFTVS